VGVVLCGVDLLGGVVGIIVVAERGDDDDDEEEESLKRRMTFGDEPACRGLPPSWLPTI